MAIWSSIILGLMSVLNHDSQFRDFREVVIIPGKHQELLAKQESIFDKDSTGCRERDLRITICSEESCKKKYQSYWKAGDDFSVLLIGKDGGVKSDWKRLVETKEIFAIIDAMPMRRSEMKKNP